MDHLVSQPKTRNQIGLASVFMLTMCAAAGLTVCAVPVNQDDGFAISLGWFIAFNGHHAILAAASTAIVIGLFQEAAALRRHIRLSKASTPDMRFALQFAWTWRLACAALLIFCLAALIVIVRSRVELPRNELFLIGDIVTGHLWWIAILVALTSLCGRASKRPAAKSQSKLIDIVIFGGATLLGVDMILENTEIAFLVHLACEGVERACAINGTRYRLMTISDQYRFAAFGVGAVAAAVLGSLLLIHAIRRSDLSKVISRMTFVAGAALMSLAGAYCRWYFTKGMSMASPDMAQAGFGGNWWLNLGGVMLGLVVATAGAARAARLDAGPDVAVRIVAGPTLLCHTRILSICLAIGAGVLLAGNIYILWDPTLFASPLEGIRYFLINPNCLIVSAIEILALQLAWQSWRQDLATLPIVVRPISKRRFLSSWSVLVIALVVGVPTLAAASFSFWLSPWYLW